MRCVLDTNIVVSALLWSGSPNQFLNLGKRGAFDLFSSAAMFEELRDVLSRKKCARRLMEIGGSLEEVLSTYRVAAEMVEPVAVPRMAPDPDDDVVICTALAAEADLLVTGDRTLLSVAEYKGVRVVSVREALDAIAQGSL